MKAAHNRPLPRSRYVHRHKLLLPGGKFYTEPDEPLGYDFINFDDTMESGIWNDSEYEDEELGFIMPLLAAIAGTGGGDSEGGGKIASPLETLGREVAAGRGILETLGIVEPQKQDQILSGISGMTQPSQPTVIQAQQPSGASPTEIQYLVKDLLGSIAPPIRQKVREVINEMKGSDASEENLITNIQQRVGSNVMPELNKALKALKLAQTQAEATSEHRTLVQEADRWRENMANQQQLMNRIIAMESKLATAIKKKKR